MVCRSLYLCLLKPKAMHNQYEMAGMQTSKFCRTLINIVVTVNVYDDDDNNNNIIVKAKLQSVECMTITCSSLLLLL